MKWGNIAFLNLLCLKKIQQYVRVLFQFARCIWVILLYQLCCISVWGCTIVFLVLSGHRNRNITVRVAYKQQEFIPHSLEAARSRIKVLAGPSDWWGPASCFRDGLLTVFSCGRRGEGAPWGLFYKSTNPTHEGPTVMTKHQKPQLQLPSCWEVVFNTWIWGHKHSVYSNHDFWLRW